MIIMPMHILKNFFSHSQKFHFHEQLNLKKAFLIFEVDGNETI